VKVPAGRHARPVARGSERRAVRRLADDPVRPEVAAGDGREPDPRPPRCVSGDGRPKGARSRQGRAPLAGPYGARHCKEPARSELLLPPLNSAWHC